MEGVLSQILHMQYLGNADMGYAYMANRILGYAYMANRIFGIPQKNNGYVQL